MRVTICVKLMLNCEQLCLKFFHVLNGKLRIARQWDFITENHVYERTLDRVLQADRLLSMLTNF
jgi:hypothetical protein